MAVLMSRTMETANCMTTRAFLKEMLPLPALNKPFSTFDGWKEDMNRAGETPQRRAIRAGVRNTGMSTEGISRLWMESCRSVMVLIQGRQSQVRAAAMM